MRSVIRTSVAVAIVAMMAASAFAALSDQYVQFGKGPASFLMTREEQAQWKTITSDADAQAFIDLFWARRDPTPGTLRNEFKEEFEQRVKYADEKFGYRAEPGSMTDRGRALVILGGPTAPIRQFRTNASTEPQEGARADMSREAGNAARQVWTYDPTKTQVPIGMPVTLMFVDMTNAGDWHLTREAVPEVARTLGTPSDYTAVFDKVRAAMITQPNITAAQIAELKANAAKQTTTTTTTKTVVTRPVPPTATPLKTASLQAAIDEARAGKSVLGQASSIAYAELVAPNGEYFVPVTLVVDKSAKLAADAGDTMFGVVEDSTGKIVTTFEEPVKPLVSNGDLAVDRTLDLGTGKYNVVVGLAKAGQPVALASRTLDLTSLSKDATGTSKLILTNDAHETPEAAPVKSPFAFGKLKIVPKSVIGNKDELTYFVELHNPGLDPASNMPKMQVKLELGGGKLQHPIGAPLSDVPAMPLSGIPGPGQYAIISSIPLGELSKPLDPGDYTLKVKLIDTVTKQSYNLEQSFKITG